MINMQLLEYFRYVFDYLPVIIPNQKVFNLAITIRREYNLKLGDSLIAATALVQNLDPYTRKVSDFEKVRGLRYVNPVKGKL